MTHKAIEINTLTRKQKIDLVKRWLDKEPIYVRFKDTNEMREGAIAKVKSWDGIVYGLKKNGVSMATRYRHHYAAPGMTTPTFEQHVVGHDTYEIDPDNISYFWFNVGWDGRRNIVQASNYEIELLVGYDGPTVWQWGKKEKPQVTPYDRLGREVQVGDFACYILHHFNKSGASTEFGTVQKIERDGTVWAKNVSLGSNEHSKLKRINDNSTIVILTKDLMDRLMMAKLSTL